MNELSAFQITIVDQWALGLHLFHKHKWKTAYEVWEATPWWNLPKRVLLRRVCLKHLWHSTYMLEVALKIEQVR